MATISARIEGARLRTLPASAVLVLLGTGIAFDLGRGNAWLVAGCLVAALAIQTGMNFVNNYSDGIRGTDEHRLESPCLMGDGENPCRVLAVALGFFALAAGVGLAVAIVNASWWLVAAGAAALVTAWFYIGGKHPYGYTGWGVSELTAFVFFGLMATLGTLWVQAKTLPRQTWLLTTALGLLPCVSLIVNNLRDVPIDTQSGKRTLAVWLGDRGAHWAYVGPVVAVLALAAVVVSIPWPAMFSSRARQWLPGFAVLLVIWGGAAATMRPVRRRATGRDLTMALHNTDFLILASGALLALFFALG